MKKQDKAKKDLTMMEKAVRAVKNTKTLVEGLTEDALRPVRDAALKMKNKEGEVGKQLKTRGQVIDEAVEEAQR